ncbi:unnamed protein product [Effrenium voratum]|nr:unnamed protein product [Effrenium voratum]
MSGVTGTLTRPFSRQPQSLVPSSPDRREATPHTLLLASDAEERDAWWHKQEAIRELQAANRSLLRRVGGEGLEHKTPPRQEKPSDEVATTGTTAGMSQERVRPQGVEAMTPLDLSRAAGWASDEGAEASNRTEESQVVVKHSVPGSRIVERAPLFDQANLQEVRRLTAAVSKLEGNLLKQEGALAEERARHHEEMQKQQTDAVEEKKKLRRETAKKVAELQARGTELAEEVQEATNKAKEAERTMHSRLSSMRQTSQRLKNQLQAEKETAEESEESARHRLTLEHSLAELRSQLEGREAAESEFQEALRSQSDAAHEEREVLLKELSDLTDDASQVRRQCFELTRRDEDREAVLRQLQERQLQSARQVAQEEQVAGQLRQEVWEAREKTSEALGRHQALLEEIRHEREAAAGQLQELRQEACMKQRTLQELLGEGVLDINEVQKMASGEGLKLNGSGVGAAQRVRLEKWQGKAHKGARCKVYR